MFCAGPRGKVEECWRELLVPCVRLRPKGTKQSERVINEDQHCINEHCRREFHGVGAATQRERDASPAGALLRPDARPPRHPDGRQDRLYTGEEQIYGCDV